MSIVTEPGIYDIPEAQYHGAEITPTPALSKSIMNTLLTKSAAHAWLCHPALNPNHEECDEAKFDIGTTAHSMLLEGVDKVFIVDADSWRTKEAKAQRDEARLNGLIPLLSKDYASVAAMVEAAKIQLRESELAIQDLPKEGKSEQSFVWEEDGLWCKARPDWMPHDGSYILDYKTTGLSANPENIARHILNMGYEIQDAFYRRGARVLLGDEVPFFFFFQETSEPYLGSLICLPPDFAALGESKVERGISLWRKCLALNEWPGYPQIVVYPELPAYAQIQWEMSQVAQEGSE
jgi:hypothetical protein